MRDKKRSCTFAPALRDTLRRVNQTKNKEEHVPRHIELTAVLREILKQKNKSNRIERFEKTTRDFSQINKETRFIWAHTIYDEEFDPGSG